MTSDKYQSINPNQSKENIAEQIRKATTNGKLAVLIGGQDRLDTVDFSEAKSYEKDGLQFILLDDQGHIVVQLATDDGNVHVITTFDYGQWSELKNRMSCSADN